MSTEMLSFLHRSMPKEYRWATVDAAMQSRQYGKAVYMTECLKIDEIQDLEEKKETLGKVIGMIDQLVEDGDYRGASCLLEIVEKSMPDEVIFTKKVARLSEGLAKRTIRTLPSISVDLLRLATRAVCFQQSGGGEIAQARLGQTCYKLAQKAAEQKRYMIAADCMEYFAHCFLVATRKRIKAGHRNKMLQMSRRAVRLGQYKAAERLIQAASNFGNRRRVCKPVQAAERKLNQLKKKMGALSVSEMNRRLKKAMPIMPEPHVIWQE